MTGQPKMIVVHHVRSPRSLRILWLLEELDIPHRLKRYRRDQQTHSAAPDLKAIHPLGKAPIIADGEKVIAGSAAIIDYLLRNYGRGRLQPHPATQAYDEYLHWMHYAEGSAIPALIVRDKLAGHLRVLPDLMRGVEEDVALHLRYIDNALDARPYILGDEFSAADIQLSVVAEMACTLEVMLYPKMAFWMARIKSRPAYRAAVDRGGLSGKHQPA